MERNVLMARQDAQEQKRKLDCLILKGLTINTGSSINPEEISSERAKFIVSNLIRKRAAVSCESEDLDFVAIKQASAMVVTSATEKGETTTNNSAASSVAAGENDDSEDVNAGRNIVFVRFVDREVRSRVWAARGFAKKNGLFPEEYLTAARQKIWLKCKELKASGHTGRILTELRSGAAATAIAGIVAAI